MIKTICATLVLLCSSFNYQWDFEYKNKDEFVLGITECTIEFNSKIPPANRVIVIVSVAQAILESNWGESRFARLGNNFYGMIETDKSKKHMKALGSNVLLKTYNRKCGSVADYITLLNIGTDFKEYRELRNKQTTLQELDLDELINSLHTFAIDKNYTKKIKKTVRYLLREYPDIFQIPMMENA